MKIRITEQEFKKLINNIINEQENNTVINSIGYKTFNDPMAIALINYINEKTDEEYGLIDVEPIRTYDDWTNWYSVGNSWYAIVTKKELWKYNLNIWKKYNGSLISKIKENK